MGTGCTAWRESCRPPDLPRSLCPLPWQGRGGDQEAAFPEELSGAAAGHRRRPSLAAGEREPQPRYAILGEAGRSSDLAGDLLCEVVALSLPVSKARLGRRVTMLSCERLREICAALGFALGCA